MKKPNFLLSVATGVGITVSMLGCGGDGVNPPLESQTQNVPARMVAVYAPATGDIPLPNDLLFGGTTDLTLNIPVEDPENFGDPSVALSSLDGWSAVAPFSMSFSSSDTGVSIDAASVVGGSSVHLYKVNVSRPDINAGLVDDVGEPLPEAGVIVPTGPVTSVERELTAGLEYVVQATSATTIAIIPTVPFEQQASYMVVLTNGLTDSDGQAILNDSQYAIAKSTSPIDPEASIAGLEPVRQLVNAMENAAAAFEGGPARSSIVSSFQFTVQSVGAVMQSAKTAYIDGPIAQGLAVGQIPSSSFSSLGVDTSAVGGLGAADLYKGSISLTYLLSAPTETNPAAPLNVHWKALQQLPIGPEGALVDNPFGDNLSYANSFPRANGVETVPLLVSVPKEDLGCEKPETGYPVTIYQHGITSNRTAMLTMADALAGFPSCRAAVAMDLPLHGIAADNIVHLGLQAATEGTISLFEGYDSGVLRERTFGLDFVDNETDEPGSDGVADTSGKHTINLQYLSVARDNTRQAILDLLYLEQVIPFMDVDGSAGFDFDGSDISYVGHSLGGIVGTSVLAYSGTNQFLGEVNPNIKSGALVNPGGGIIKLLDSSPTFGPSIRGGLAGAFGLEEGTPEFEAQLAAYYFAAQTILDSSDPINTSAHAVANNVPTLMLQNLDDAVVPNFVLTAPLSGTEPLARTLGLETLVADEAGTVVGSRIFSKINTGGHSSIAIPDDATVEMQSQVVSFLASGGTAVVVTDPTLLDD